MHVYMGSKLNMGAVMAETLLEMTHADYEAACGDRENVPEILDWLIAQGRNPNYASITRDPVLTIKRDGDKMWAEIWEVRENPNVEGYPQVGYAGLPYPASIPEEDGDSVLVDLVAFPVSDLPNLEG